MGATLYQFLNLILVLSIIGIPISVTVILLKRYGSKTDPVNSLELLVNKINELENRVQVLEDKLEAIDID